MTFVWPCGISFYACAPLAHGKRLGENPLKIPRASLHNSYISDAMPHKLKVPQPSQSLICVFYTDCHAFLNFPSPVCDLESDFKQMQRLLWDSPHSPPSSRRTRSCTTCFPVSRNSCLKYFAQFSSCLQVEGKSEISYFIMGRK